MACVCVFLRASEAESLRGDAPSPRNPPPRFLASISSTWRRSCCRSCADELAPISEVASCPICSTSSILVSLLLLSTGSCTARVQNLEVTCSSGREMFGSYKRVASDAKILLLGLIKARIVTRLDASPVSHDADDGFECLALCAVCTCAGE